MAAGAVLAYVVARHWRSGLVFAAAIVPSLVVLALWKERGLGRIPALGLEEARLAAGAATTAISVDLHQYFDFDLEHWRKQMDYLREFFWSARLAQWAPVAGLIAVLRVRRGAIAALLAGWLAAFLVVKGFSPRADIQANTFWRLLLPAWPAYLLLFASIPLLVPTLARRLGERLRAPTSPPVARKWIVVAAVLTVLLPAVAIAASSPLEGPALAVTQDDQGNFILTPVDEGVDVNVERVPEGRLLTWHDGPWHANVFYRVYRAEGEDVECENSDGHPAQSCYVRGTPIATVRERKFLDTQSPPGATYRIGVGTNWIDDPEFGDVFAFSPPVSEGG